MELVTIYLLIHIVGAMLAAGAAFYSDGIFLLSSSDGRISKDERRILELGTRYVWAGIF